MSVLPAFCELPPGWRQSLGARCASRPHSSESVDDRALDDSLWIQGGCFPPKGVATAGSERYFSRRFLTLNFRDDTRAVVEWQEADAASPTSDILHSARLVRAFKRQRKRFN